MKLRNKGKLSLLLLAMLLCLTTPAFASTVKYEGPAQKFVFVSQNGQNDTDLFDNFKGVMPGDTAIQTIDVRNDGDNSDPIKVYLRAEVHDEQTNAPVTEQAVVSMHDFLSQLNMKVLANGTEIYNASPDQLHGLQSNVLLGEVDAGKSISFTVELAVPIELSNEYANRVGEVDWVFVVEEAGDQGGTDPGYTPAPTPDDPHWDWNWDWNSPQTSDETNALLWAALLVLGVVSLICVQRRPLKKTKKRNKAGGERS